MFCSYCRFNKIQKAVFYILHKKFFKKLPYIYLHFLAKNDKIKYKYRFPETAMSTALTKPQILHDGCFFVTVCLFVWLFSQCPIFLQRKNEM